MDIYQARMKMKTCTIYDLSMRVVYYARVSTDSDAQENSIKNQNNYYQNLIEKTPSWTFAGAYVDDGVTGTSTRKRENFNQMIEDAKAGKFDFIITKEISRFARDTLASLRYTRELLNYGVCVFFQNDNINTIDEDSELRLTIMSGIAQDESRKTSSRVKFGHQQAIKNGVVLGNGRIFGYDYNGGKLTVNDYEAEMVRKVFDLYATGEYSLKQIGRMLSEEGYRNRYGKSMTHTTLAGIIKNPKYKGYYVGNKVRIVDLFTKKQKFLPPDEWVMYKDETGETVPALVSEEIWDKANKILTGRSNDVKSRKNQCNHMNLLTGKLYCTHCKMPYYRKTSTSGGKPCSTWKCSGKIKNGAKSCPSVMLHEDEIKQVMVQLFSSCANNTAQSAKDYLRILESKVVSIDVTGEIKKLEEQLATVQKKQMKLLELVSVDAISMSDFKRMNDACTNEQESIEAEISKLQEAKQGNKQLRAQVNRVKKILDDLSQTIASTDDVSSDIVSEYVDRINVYNENGVIRMEFCLFTSEKITETYSRSGHTLNDMCTGGLLGDKNVTCKFKRKSRNMMGHKNIITVSSYIKLF